jgi:hypothetical protein
MRKISKRSEAAETRSDTSAYAPDIDAQITWVNELWIGAFY